MEYWSVVKKYPPLKHYSSTPILRNKLKMRTNRWIGLLFGYRSDLKYKGR
jgi:hypothetical protein